MKLIALQFRGLQVLMVLPYDEAPDFRAFVSGCGLHPSEFSIKCAAACVLRL